MIQFDKDGVTLFYIDASGQRVAHGYTEGEAYADMLTIRSAQIQAVSDNKLIRVLIAAAGDDSNVKALSGDPRKYTYLYRTEDMPQGVHTLKHLPRSTEALYCTVRTECLKQAA